MYARGAPLWHHNFVTKLPDVGTTPEHPILRGSSLIQRTPYPPRARRLRVQGVEDLSTTMRRIVLTGPDLEPEFPFRPLATADHVKLAFPDPNTGDLVLPQGGERGLQSRNGRAPIMRDYTIRLVDHDAHELSIDFVLHSRGPAGHWATNAATGDEIGVLGPRGTQIYPGTCADYLLVGDETAMPAIERFLQELPTDAMVTTVLFASGEAHRKLGNGRGEIHWLPELDPADAAPAVVDAVSRLEIGPGTFAWGAGEAGVMRAVRKHLRGERAMDTDHVVIKGYWRTGVAGALPPGQD